MDQLKQLQTLVMVAQKGSLSAAAGPLGVSAAIVGRRLDALEARLGVKLLLRTTRTLALTAEGEALVDNGQRILADWSSIEASISQGGVKARGHLRITAPGGFGRKHIAPAIARFMAAYPDISCMLDLSDRVVDVLNEGYDCAIRIGALPDSSLVSTLLAQNRRVVVASPAYWAEHGVPQTPDDLAQHRCMVLSTQRGWSLHTSEGRPFLFKPNGRLECNDGAVLHAWALAGLGVVWRSRWEVAEDLAQKRLVSVLDSYAAPPMGIYIIFPQRKHLPQRMRVFIEFLKETFQAGVEGEAQA